MDKPIEEWKRRMRGTDPERLLALWRAKAEEKVSWIEEPNFHMAVAERMKQLGYLSLDLEEDDRKELCQQAIAILDRLANQFEKDPDKWEEYQQLASNSERYFQKFGSKTSRFYMYERGMIDLLGDPGLGKPSQTLPSSSNQ